MKILFIAMILGFLLMNVFVGLNGETADNQLQSASSKPVSPEIGHQDNGLNNIESLSSRSLPEQKIAEGENAKLGEFPYQVSLQYGYALLHSHVCGASIINERTVVTAGQCVTEVPHIPLAHYWVVAGIVNLKDKGQVIRVKRTIVHPDYNGGVNPNDIAVLELQEPLQFNDHVQSIALPNANEEPAGTVTLTGWGRTSDIQILTVSDYLEKVNLSIVSFSDCSAWLGESPLDPISNICAGPLDKTSSACYKESGSPLVSTANGKPILVGIYSWSEIPCKKGAPSVFTKVSNFIDFINDAASQ